MQEEEGPDIRLEEMIEVPGDWQEQGDSFARERFVTEPLPQQQHLYTRRHPNGLLVLFMGEGHPALQQQQQQAEVEYLVDALQEPKKKKRKQQKQRFKTSVVADTPLCRVGDQQVACGVRGLIMQLNERLVDHPERLRDPKLGWLAIFKPFEEREKKPRKKKH